MPREFTRPPEGFTFAFGGMKTNARADVMPPTKYPLAVNVRQYFEHQLGTRPGLGTGLFSMTTVLSSAPDLRAYSALKTDDLPRILVRASDDTIWLDNGVQVGTLAGGGATRGATLIPFRPNASPQPWMYVANGNDYQKFSSPDALNNVTQENVGIAEPPTAPDAFIYGYNESQLSPASTGWIAGGTAGAASAGSRVSDTTGTVLVDPASSTMLGNKLQSIQVATTKQYQRMMTLTIGGAANFHRVEDVFAPFPTAMQILGIFYFPPGPPGRCVLTVANAFDSSKSIYGQNPLASFRRGSLIKFSGGGAEVAIVLSVTTGPDNTVAIETVTSATHTTAETITALPAIQVVANAAASQAIAAPTATYSVTTGIGTQTNNIGTGAFSPFGAIFQPDDYITFGILVDDLTKLTEVKFLIDVDDGTFTKNFYYYTIRASDVAAAIANAATQLATAQTTAQRAQIDAETAAINEQAFGVDTLSGAQTVPGSNQWTQIAFPLLELTRVGSDQTKTLQNAVKLQFLWNASGTINVATDTVQIIGGFQPDVGDVGAPYLYRVRPRSKVTGVVGNPSPATRYGISPRRTQCFVNLPSAAYDPQIDTWDVFRFGGTVTEWRFIGSTPSTNQQFEDNYDDDAARGGDALDFDNFEPWPSIDLPNNGAIVSLVGTTAVVTSTAASILNYLPGTLVQIGGQNVYTLQTRPTLVSGSNYLLQFIENAGTAAGGTPFAIQEPILARQRLPFMWGPDVNGTVFACGDPLRPGTLYFSKGNNPDAAPDSYNIEITNPSEPLQGGEVLDGLSFVASTEWWWALYPQPGNPTQRYNVVKQPMPRGLAAPFGHCNDGVSIYWWARDGIYSSTEGSLTDADLYNLFPHEGVSGRNLLVNGVFVYAPDYSLVNRFRLSYANGYLYATYPLLNGGGGYAPVLVYDIRQKSWMIDEYGNGLTPGRVLNVYQIEQAPGSSGVTNPVVLMARQSPAKIYAQTQLADDDGQAITCQVATFEFDGGDKRAPKQWGDLFLDCLPAAIPSGISVTPMSLGAPIAAANTIPASGNRQRVPLALGTPGTPLTSDFLGLFIQWTDDFSVQGPATQLYLWQPSLAVLPAAERGWTSFGTSFGMKGFVHLRQLELAWVSTAPITITATPVDGQAPAPIVVPSSGGAYKKQVFPFSANKGLLYSFTVSSASPFQIFNDDSELYVGEWGRQDAYQVFRGFGGRTADDAPV